MAKRRTRRKTSKSQVVKQFLAEHPDAMPVAVVEALAQEGVKVNAGLVSTIKSSLKRAGQGKRKGRRAAPAASSGDIPFSAILQAKQMVAKLGDIEKAKQALAALAELTQ